MTFCKIMWMTEYLRSLLRHFTTLLDILHKFNYTHMYEYLMKRKVIVLSADGVVIDNVMLPVAEKILQSVFVWQGVEAYATM